MRNTIILGSLAAILALTAIAATAKDKPQPDFTTTTDKFTGVTTTLSAIVPVESRGSAWGQSVGLTLIGSYRSDAAGKVALIVRCSAAEWQFLNGADVHVLADGVALDLGHFERIDSNVTADGVVRTVEVLAAQVPVATLEQFAIAKKLEIKVGLLEGDFGDGSLAHLRGFAGAVAASRK